MGLTLNIVFIRQVMDANGKIIIQDSVTHIFKAVDYINATSLATLNALLGVMPQQPDIDKITKCALALNPGVTPAALQIMQTAWPQPSPITPSTAF